MTFEPLMDFRQTIMEVRNIPKAATLKNFVHLSYKNTQLFSFVIVLFNIFMRQTLYQWFLGVTQKYELRVSFKVTKPQWDGIFLKVYVSKLLRICHSCIVACPPSFKGCGVGPLKNWVTWAGGGRGRNFFLERGHKTEKEGGGLM